MVKNDVGIKSLLNNVKLTLSSDHLGFNNKTPKNTSESIYQISSLFSQSLTSGLMPSNRRLAKVIRGSKSGNHSNPRNYRSISN